MARAAGILGTTSTTPEAEYTINASTRCLVGWADVSGKMLWLQAKSVEMVYLFGRLSAYHFVRSWRCTDVENGLYS